MSDETIETTNEPPKKKRGRPRKNVQSQTGNGSQTTWSGMASKHPAAYAAATLRLISQVSTENEVKILASKAAVELDSAAA